jgi:hypothetical protein
MPTVEAGEVEKPATMLLQLHGKEGVELSAAGIQSNKAGPGLATEAPITIKARPPRNKILSEAPQLEKQEYFAPLLNTTFELPQAKTGATILDLRVAITGRDSAGYRFHRKLYHNVIELEPLKNWRHRTKKSRAVFFTLASVQQVCYEDGVIVGLLLAHGPYQRAVRITNPILRQQLDKLSFDGLAEGDLHFGVRGDELLTVVRLLPDAPIAGDEL